MVSPCDSTGLVEVALLSVLACRFHAIKKYSREKHNRFATTPDLTLAILRQGWEDDALTVGTVEGEGSA